MVYFTVTGLFFSDLDVDSIEVLVLPVQVGSIPTVYCKVGFYVTAPKW